MNITVLSKNHTSDTVKAIITPNHLTVTLLHNAGNENGANVTEERVIDADLFGLVDAERSTVAIMKSKVRTCCGGI